MTKINLTEEEKAQIIDAINNNVEPEPDLVEKLFPRLVDKVDFKKLDRAKIPTLEYAGKRSEASILNETLLYEGGSPLQVERCFEGGKTSDETQLDIFEKSQDENPDNDWRNLIVQGDNLQFLKTCYQNTDPLIKDKVKGKVKLIYIDPPFATKSDFGGKDGESSYSDKVDRAEFIEGLRERLVYLRELLADDGSLYLHLDEKMSHYAKIVVDEIFGIENFQREIIWSTKTVSGFKSQANNWIRGHDTILYYTLGNPVFHSQYNEYDEKYLSRFKKMDNEGRRYRDDRGSGKIQYLDELPGVKIGDVWDDIMSFQQSATSSEILNYPTQKPEKMLERIINASSNENDLILDCFAGSGTTAAVAEKLGRRWIACDFGKHSIYTMQKRILRIAESKALGGDTKANEKYGQPPKPFCVVSCGAYDFSRIMNLKKNKEAYVNFVLGLFQLPREEKNLNSKYKLANIYGEKDGNPVEVYPVWDDEYLKNVKIDEEYLQEIIRQSGGRLKGVYYIITPETCTVVSDTVLQNGAGDEVHFKLLKFPYKILEDVARRFNIEEQPSAQENVNNLINSTGFYFNNDVEFEAERTTDGLKITKFNSRILDKNGNRYEGLSALAMLLVDIDYNNEIFDMETTVFAKEIDEEGKCKVAGLTDSVAIIAIDKHGNESKPFILKK